MPRQTTRPRSLSQPESVRRARRVIAALALTVAGLAIAIHARQQPAQTVDVVCDSASWAPLDEPGAFPADRAQVCHLGTVDGPPVRVVDLD